MGEICLRASCNGDVDEYRTDHFVCGDCSTVFVAGEFEKTGNGGVS